MTGAPFPRKGARGSLAPKYDADGHPAYKSIEGALGAALRTAEACRAPVTVWVSGDKGGRLHVVTLATAPAESLPPATSGGAWVARCTVRPAGAGLES